MDVAAELADKPSRNAALANAEKILLDDYIFAPVSIVPSRHLVTPSLKGWDTSVAGYNNSQWLHFE